MKELFQYLNQKRSRHLRELFLFLEIASISADSKNKKDIKNCANFLVRHLKKIGLQNVKTLRANGNPFVYGEWLGGRGKPTVLAYGHYDVQPVDPLELWKTPPFRPSIRAGRIYARGAGDNKGNIFAYFKAIEAYLKTRKALPVNLKVLLEGEEEIGSPSSGKFLRIYRKLLGADAVLNSDFGNIRDNGTPEINLGVRGLCGFEIKAIGSVRDLHSGFYGGAVVNPNFALIWLLSKLKDQNSGKILIPGFYDAVLPITEEEKKAIKKIPFDEKAYKKKIGVAQFFGEKEFNLLERVGYRPTVEINGISGGYSGEGFKTVIPAESLAKVSMRLVSEQNPQKIAKLFEDYLKKKCPPTINIKIKRMGGMAKPWVINRENPYLKIVALSFKKAFNKNPIFIRNGATIGIVSEFAEVLNVPVLSMSFGGDNCHAPNENLKLADFYKGIKTVIYFFQEMSKTRI